METISPSKPYLVQWAESWGVRETIERRTGLTPRLRLELPAVELGHQGLVTGVLVECSENCHGDLLALVARLDGATLTE